MGLFFATSINKTHKIRDTLIKFECPVRIIPSFGGLKSGIIPQIKNHFMAWRR